MDPIINYENILLAIRNNAIKTKCQLNVIRLHCKLYANEHPFYSL